MLKVHETARPDGSLAPTLLSFEAATLFIISDEGSQALPDGALDAVFSRYGKPLERGERLVSVAELELSGGARLRHVRHLARYDVIARDWLVYEDPAGRAGQEPLCALATTIAGALHHLARAYQS